MIDVSRTQFVARVIGRRKIRTLFSEVKIRRNKISPGFHGRSKWRESGPINGSQFGASICMLGNMSDAPGDNDLRRARSGDRAALERLLTRNEQRLTNLAHARLGDGLRGRIRTSDLLQSTYLEVVRTIDRFDGENEDAFVGWLGRILENNIRDKFRYFGAKKRLGDGKIVSIECDDQTAGSASREDPLHILAASEDKRIVDRALEKLPDDYRRVLTLRIKEGRNTKEVADLMDRSEGAVRVLLVRAKAALALEIEQIGKDRASPAEPDSRCDIPNNGGNV